MTTPKSRVYALADAQKGIMIKMIFPDVKSLIIDEIPSYSFRRLQTRLCELQRQYEITEAYLKAKYANKSTI